jgi:hypothetical protein
MKDSLLNSTPAEIQLRGAIRATDDRHDDHQVVLTRKLGCQDIAFDAGYTCEE